MSIAKRWSLSMEKCTLTSDCELMAIDNAVSDSTGQ